MMKLKSKSANASARKRRLVKQLAFIDAQIDQLKPRLIQAASQAAIVAKEHDLKKAFRASQKSLAEAVVDSFAEASEEFIQTGNYTSL